MHFCKHTVIHYELNDVLHIIWLVGAFRYEVVQGFVFPIGTILRPHAWRIFTVVLRQIRQEVPDSDQAFRLAVACKMRYTALRGVGYGSTEFFKRDIFVRNRFDHIRSSDEHVACVLHHEYEVGDSRRVDGAAR